MTENSIVSFDLDFQNKLWDIQYFMDEAIAHAVFNGEESSDEEGYIEVSLPTFHGRERGNKDVSIGIFTHLLGPDRMHYFDSVDKALAAVRQWYEEEVTDCSDCLRCIS